jgi:hypothetical protein
VAKLTFQLARCGYTLRVTSQTYSTEYITPTHTTMTNKMIATSLWKENFLAFKMHLTLTIIFIISLLRTFEII